MPSAPTETAPLRVGLCITELEVGGAEQCLAHLAMGLDRARFDRIVYCLAPRPERGRDSLVSMIESCGVSVHCLGGRGTRDAPAVFSRLVRRLKADRPHVLQTFLFHANILGRLAAWRSGVPHVVSGIRVAERRSRWYLRLDRWTARLVDRHVCVSEAVAEFSRREAGLPSDRIVVIPNGIDLDRFDKETQQTTILPGVARGRRIIVCISRLDPQKGVLELLDAAPAMLKRLPEHDLVFVGTGPLAAELERRRAAMGLAGRVHFAGFRTDVPQILRASDMLVLMSRWEGMPNVVLEAMAASRPVVATDVEGVREILGNNAHGQLVPPGDGQRFVEAVVSILHNPQLADEIAQNNRRRVENTFDLAQMIERYARVYASFGAPR